ncbi:MAG: hypothetical protein JWN08_2024 [Frankiales bacterium]|nr:hypothetical protein [Frankiales bacterium]
MVRVRPLRRRPPPPLWRGSVLRLQGTSVVPSSRSAVLRRASGAQRPTPSRPRVVTTCLASLVGLLVALGVPAPALAAPEQRSTPDASIEALSPYQGQATCDPVVRAGVAAFRDLVLAAYPATGDSGILRACSVGGTSEHKEGRAWDWRVSTSNAVQVAQVDDLLAWLMAPDEQGNAAAMARRLGVMYVIWNCRVWKSYQAAKGWQPYVGSSPHTDHVHVSFSWAGAYGRTSYWTGQVSPVLYAPVKAAPGSATPTATVGLTPVVDRRSQVDRRRGAVGSLPGPWRRH